MSDDLLKKVNEPGSLNSRSLLHSENVAGRCVQETPNDESSKERRSSERRNRVEEKLFHTYNMAPPSDPAVPEALSAVQNTKVRKTSTLEPAGCLLHCRGPGCAHLGLPMLPALVAAPKAGAGRSTEIISRFGRFYGKKFFATDFSDHNQAELPSWQR